MKKLLGIALAVLLMAPAPHAQNLTPIYSTGQMFGVGGFNMHLDQNSLGIVCNVTWRSRTGTKTLSAAGGGSFTTTTGNGVTWANAGSRMDFGIQDVGADGLPDGTFDVSAQMIGNAAPTLSNNSLFEADATNGSKTVSHLQLIAVVLYIESIAGGDNPVLFRYKPDSPWEPATGQPVSGLPYGTSTSGGVFIKDDAGMAGIALKFDDGDIGWCLGAAWAQRGTTADVAAFASNTTPSEWAVVFSFDYDVPVCGGGFQILNVATGDTFESRLYADPEGTPTEITSWDPDPDQLFSGRFQTFPLTCEVLTGGTLYALSVTPTTTGAITVRYYAGQNNFEYLKEVLPFSVIKWSSRSGGPSSTNPFVEAQDYEIPNFGLLVDLSQMGGGGGPSSYGGVQ